MSGTSDQAVALALAGGAITAQLLGTLYDKGVLDLDESRAILNRAMTALGPLVATGNGNAAQRIIADMMKTKFSARG